MTQCTELIARLEPFVQGLGKAILREAADAIEALCVQSNKRGTLAIANGIRMEHAEAERDALQAEVERLQREVVSRNQRALDGDLAVKVRDAELLINDTLRAQLAAAQGQSVNMDLLVALKLAVRQNNHDMLLTGDELRFCKAAINSAQATPIPQQVAEPAPTEPDMFWNDDDPERPYSSIDEFLNDEICNGTELEVGHTRTIQRAIRLPNIEIRITSVRGEECEADYEVIAAAPQPKDMK